MVVFFFQSSQSLNDLLPFFSSVTVVLRPAEEFVRGVPDVTFSDVVSDVIRFAAQVYSQYSGLMLCGDLSRYGQKDLVGIAFLA